MKKIMLSIICCLCILTGCVRTQFKEITIPQLADKIKAKDSFVLIVSRESCEHCQLLKEMLDETMKEHHTVIYNVSMDESSYDNLIKDVKTLEKYVSEPGTTPHVYYIKDGKEVDSFEGFSRQKPYEFWDFIAKYGLENAK